jgi:hypothetical protein
LGCTSGKADFLLTGISRFERFRDRREYAAFIYIERKYFPPQGISFRSEGVGEGGAGRYYATIAPRRRS